MAAGVDKKMLWLGDTVLAQAFLSYCRTANHPAKIRLTRWLARSLFPRGVPVPNGLGAHMAIDCDDFIGHSIAYSGAYEPLSLSLAARLMKDGGVFVDVGCNVGLYSLTLGVIPGVRCISIDGSPRALAALELNLARNEQVQGVTVNALLGAADGISELELPDKFNLGMMRVRRASNEDSPRRLLASSTTLEAVLARVGWQPVKLLKIDVEGAEHEVFRGLDWTGPFAPDNIIMEYSHRVSDLVHESRFFLESRGYLMFCVTGDSYQAGAIPPEENCWFRRT